MNARDVIDAVIYFENDSMAMSNETTIGETFGADAILSALRSAGWAVVPVEPTREMLNAAIDTDRYKLGDISPLGFRCSPQQMFNKAYEAMLKAAQEDSRG